ncbi:hypothetical protein Bbelb_117860 [Branchiostoma belcheri]|nr:hypothetical protein Bbelb_117860 [Branchiostoma belcheri]
MSDNLELNFLNVLLVAAVDFGTTFSGYGFAFPHSKEFIAFGFDAVEKYANLTEEGEDKSYYFFEHFKMSLHSKHAEVRRDMPLAASNGKTLPALDVFSHALKFLSDHLRDAVTVSTGAEIEAHSIRWVITVPAIWSDAAKHFMREAAYKAGIASMDNRKQLLIALEPEAASLFCRQLNVYKFREDTDKPTSLQMDQEERYMVVDCGGGTVDVTVHEIRHDGSMRELHRPTGGPWGGTNAVVAAVSDRAVRVLVPEEACLAVIKGAVMFGRNPNAIRERVSARTYGVRSMTTFIDGLHPLQKKVVAHGTALATDIFNKFVGVDELVELQCRRSIDFKAVRDDQRSATVYLFSTSERDPQFTTDHGMSLCGRIHVDMPDTRGGRERVIRVTFIFGGTEIDVQAEDLTSHMRAFATIDFLTKHNP